MNLPRDQQLKWEKYFDDIAEKYDDELKKGLGIFSNNDISKYSTYKIDRMRQILPKVPATILEFGCGTGRNIPYLAKIFPASKILGCDISGKSLETAKKNNPQAQFNKIEKPDDLLDIYKEKLDCIFISNVFQYIPVQEHQIWMDSFNKILREDSTIILFEQNPYNPVTNYIFKNIEMDQDLNMLKPSYCTNLFKKAKFNNVKREYTFFFLWRNKLLLKIERALFWLPLGAQYCVYARGCKK